VKNRRTYKKRMPDLSARASFLETGVPGLKHFWRENITMTFEFPFRKAWILDIAPVVYL